jgi:hypothetical protein
MELTDHEQFISFMLLAIAKLAFLTSRWTKVQRGMPVGARLAGMRTFIDLTIDLHKLGCRHPYLLLYQAI